MRPPAAASLLATLVMAVTSPAASADTPRCVSRYEYSRISKGMPMDKVHRIFDTTGNLTGLGDPNQIRHYRPCTPQGVVQVTYTQAGRVVSKSAQFFG